MFRILPEIKLLKICVFLLIIIVIIWFGDTVVVTHLTKCNTNSKVRAICRLNKPHPFLRGAFHPTQPHPHARKREHGRRLTIMPWTTTDEFNVIPKIQRMSLASFPGMTIFIIFKTNTRFRNTRYLCRFIYQHYDIYNIRDNMATVFIRIKNIIREKSIASEISVFRIPVFKSTTIHRTNIQIESFTLAA